MPRWAAFAGLGFVVLFAAGAWAYGRGAGTDAVDIAEYYASHSNRMHQLAGFAMVGLAAVLLAVFAAGAASRLSPSASLVAVAAGAASAVLLIGANALWAASAFTVEIESAYQIDPRTHLIIEDTGFAFFISAAAAALPLVAAVSVGGAFPRWFAWTAVPVALALAASYFYLPFFGFLAWVAVAAVLSLRVQPTGRT